MSSKRTTSTTPAKQPTKRRQPPKGRSTQSDSGQARSSSASSSANGSKSGEPTRSQTANRTGRANSAPLTLGKASVPKNSDAINPPSYHPGYANHDESSQVNYGSTVRPPAYHPGYVTRNNSRDFSRNNAGYTNRYSPGVATSDNTGKIVAGILAVVAILVLAWVFLLPKPFEVTLNGSRVTVDPGSTVSTLVDKGEVRPIPGNLMAVDGSLLTMGAGEPFSATVNGQPASGDTKLEAGMAVEIGNGGNLTEDSTDREEAIPFQVVEGNTDFGSYFGQAIHLLSKGQEGIQRAKVGTVSGKEVVEVVKPAVNAGYLTYNAQPADKVVALTFDDGPWPDTTGQILDILQQNNAKATFFTIGRQIPEYPDLVKRAHDMGCQVATHTWDHASGSGGGTDLSIMSPDEQIAEVTQGFDAIASATGAQPSRVMRAPGGNFYGDTIATLWPYVDAEIGWNVDTQDWALPGVESIVDSLLGVQPGNVVLLHDGGGDRSQTVEALRLALPKLAEQGYTFVTIDELLAYGIPQ